MDNKFPDPPKTTGLFHEQNVEIREMRSPTVRRFDLGNNQAGLVVFFVFAAMFVGFGIQDVLANLADLAHKCDTNEAFAPLLTATTVGLSAAAGYFFGNKTQQHRLTPSHSLPTP